MVRDEEHDDRGVDHQPVGERVGDTAEVRLDTPPAREETVDLVGDPGDGEDDAGGPAVPAVGGEHQHDEDRDQQ